MEPLILRASTSLKTLTATTEKSLRELQYQYSRSGNETLAEFEVSVPAYFRIVLESNQTPRVRGLLIPGGSDPKGTVLEIRFGLDASPAEYSAAQKEARRFVKVLTENLPTPPWSGLGFLGSRGEKSRWTSAAREIA